MPSVLLFEQCLASKMLGSATASVWLAAVQHQTALMPAKAPPLHCLCATVLFSCCCLVLPCECPVDCLV